jgi:hypothetical protein
MFEIARYTAAHADEWNRFVAASKNGTFLFDRRYMDYHADRFQDESLMFYAGGRLLAVLPAHVKGDTLCSHNGLTYGGLVMSEHLTMAQTMALFADLNGYLRQEGFRRVVYKSVPWIYHRLSAEEDLYALYHECKARIVARDYATAIFLGAGVRWERVRRRGVQRAVQAGLVAERSNDFAPFWRVLTDNLTTKYGVRPVHTLSEIELLSSRFPENIVQYVARRGDEVLAGIVLYVTPRVVHAQYSSATAEGKRLGAIDFLYERIINHDYAGYPYFDFGRSTENPDGSGLNENLVFQKEGYGGRGLCYDIYEYDL